MSLEHPLAVQEPVDSPALQTNQIILTQVFLLLFIQTIHIKRTVGVTPDKLRRVVGGPIPLCPPRDRGRL